ncbi:MAG: I78 family peptidase inhibitor [Rhodobacteraceae bacterium]|nr:I78 family peptidase inhibitor [Paracoccaceae bacterium]
MRQALIVITMSAAALSACADASVTRAATRAHGICDAEGLDRFVGRPVVDLAANAALRPMRVLLPGEPPGPVEPGRLTIRSDGAGRVAALSCG